MSEAQTPRRRPHRVTSDETYTDRSENAQPAPLKMERGFVSQSEAPAPRRQRQYNSQMDELQRRQEEKMMARRRQYEAELHEQERREAELRERKARLDSTMDHLDQRIELSQQKNDLIQQQNNFLAYAASNAQPIPQPTPQPHSILCCPECGSDNVHIETFQENQGSSTKSTTRSKFKERRHSILWWIFIGWWWWIIDISLWVCLFPIRFLFQIFRKKKYVGKSKTKSKTINKIAYRTVCTCNNCGCHWER